MSRRVPRHGERSPGAEQVDIDHWRRVARQRSAALDAVQRKPLVRIALRLERDTLPLRRVASRWRTACSRTGRRAALVARARLLQGHVGRRREALRAAIDGLPPPPERHQAVAVVVVGPTPREGAPTAPGACVPPAEETRRVAGGRDESWGSCTRRAIAETSSELICIMTTTTEPLEDGWLARLAEPIEGEVVAAAPTLVHPGRSGTRATPHDLLVREAGRSIVAEAGAPSTRARMAGAAVDPHRPVARVQAGAAACILIARHAYETAGGLPPGDDLDVAVTELCARLGAGGGHIVSVPGALLHDHRPVDSVRQLTVPIRESGREWRHAVDRCGPLLLGVADPRAHLRFALTVAAPLAKVATRWGDWHLAEGLAAGLRRRGHHARVQTLEHVEELATRSCDVHVVLRGLEPVRRSPGQRHVLWVISHPETVETSECDDADLVLVASERFADDLRARTATPVEVMLQATDHRRFRPREADPSHAHPITVVAKSRDVLRPMVADALAAGLRPAIYGSGWTGLVDETLVVADRVENDQLPVIYSSAGVVLNDHWDTMRAWGLVSNRIFDVLACGAPIVSDHLPEIEELFGDAVPTYETPEELAAVVREALGDPVAARRRAARGRESVLGAHTFDHRAEQLLDSLAAHGLDAPPGARSVRPQPE